MFALDLDDPTPIYAQLDRAIRAAIASGTLRSGDKLPTVRQLAVDLRINANTVARVYAELERQNVVATQRGVGTFVRDPAESLATRTSAREKERALTALTDRLLAEAYVLGLTIDEVIRHLEHRRSQESR